MDKEQRAALRKLAGKDTVGPGISRTTILQLLDYIETLEKDAARYRWLRIKGLQRAWISLGTDCDGENYVQFKCEFKVPEPPNLPYEDDECLEWADRDFDTAIDAALQGETMGLLRPEEIWEMLRLERKELPKIVQEIVSSYNLNTEAGIRAALRQAVWAGICEGKGWND